MKSARSRSPSSEIGEEEDQNDNVLPEICCFWPLSLLNKRPIARLFLVMFFNGLLSVGCAAAIMQIERPAQARSHITASTSIMHD